MSIRRIKIAGKEVSFHKSIVQPEFGKRNVLTNSPWAFVELWLKRNRKDEALEYWEQARHFHLASVDLPIQSAPLLLYYAFMNAIQALLASKDISFKGHHGVKAGNESRETGMEWLKQESVKIKNTGVLPSLAEAYFQESETTKTHSLDDLFYNMPFIHRTYCLTFEESAELFVPVKDCEYVQDSETNKIFFRAVTAKDIDWSEVKTILPPSLTEDQSRGSSMRSRESVPLISSNPLGPDEISALRKLHRQLRLDLYYINGSLPLWYLRTRSSRVLSRSQLTIILAAMHRLSEICRYHPSTLVKVMNGPINWLLHEFITMSPAQFFDEVAAEITGYQFLIPNVRTPP
jgi:uncharacterized protein (UPF0332 family)